MFKYIYDIARFLENLILGENRRTKSRFSFKFGDYRPRKVRIAQSIYREYWNINWSIHLPVQ